MTDRADAELAAKLTAVRASLEQERLAAVRLRGADWFAWGTCGGSSVVLLTEETGRAELLVTRDSALVLTDTIEAQRLRDEELPPALEVVAAAWQSPEEREALVREALAGGSGGREIASDRPAAFERPLPASLVAARRRLRPEEVARYRALGADAAAAVTAVMTRAGAEWRELDLAGAAAEALFARGIHPALTLVAGERRLPAYRHPTPGPDRLGGRAMLVVCGRRHGLYANLTRFVAFRPPTREERRLADDVARVEAAAFAASEPGASLGAVYAAIAGAYASLGHPGADAAHHQGGTTGYLSREATARPGLETRIEAESAVAWNPSLPGAKIEDTVLVRRGGLEILTVDPGWPTVSVEGRGRPDLLVTR